MMIIKPNLACSWINECTNSISYSRFCRRKMKVRRRDWYRNTYRRRPPIWAIKSSTCPLIRSFKSIHSERCQLFSYAIINRTSFRNPKMHHQIKTPTKRRKWPQNYHRLRLWTGNAVMDARISRAKSTNSTIRLRFKSSNSLLSRQSLRLPWIHHDAYQ